MIINELNNFEPIKKFMNDHHVAKDEFYQVLIIRRKKDPGNESVSQHVKTIKCYLVNKEIFASQIEEIVHMCRAFNARAYVNLTPKSIRIVDFAISQQLATELFEGHPSNPYSKINSIIASEPGQKKNRVFMFDIDKNDKCPISLIEDEIYDVLENTPRLRDDNSKIEINRFDSVSGCHLITQTFNRTLFEETICNKYGYTCEDGKFSKSGQVVFEMKVNSSTILYSCTNTDYIKEYSGYSKDVLTEIDYENEAERQISKMIQPNAITVKVIAKEAFKMGARYVSNKK